VRIRDVAKRLPFFFRHGTLGLNNRRQRVPWQAGLGGTLEVVCGHFMAQLDLQLVYLPALVIRKVRGSDDPAGARKGELLHHDGARDAVHLDEPLPNMLPLEQGRAVMSWQDGDAKCVQLQADGIREEARLRLHKPRGHRALGVCCGAKDRAGAARQAHSVLVEVG
jgi:hypothetical protein